MWQRVHLLLQGTRPPVLSSAHTFGTRWRPCEKKIIAKRTTVKMIMGLKCNFFFIYSFYFMQSLENYSDFLYLTDPELVSQSNVDQLVRLYPIAERIEPTIIQEAR